VTGGGRIKKDDGSKDILVYGHSYGFGRANHSISADLIRKAYPDFKVEWSNDGY
jgi:phosphohistidine phosphatase